MPAVSSELEFLKDIPLYKQEKPYLVLPLDGTGLDPERDKITNIELETRPVHILDMRHGTYNISENGFQKLSHRSDQLPPDNLEKMNLYKDEISQVLYQVFPDAEAIVTWDFRVRAGLACNKAYLNLISLLKLRKNTTFDRTSFDMNDPLLVEGPAKGAHIDATIDSGPVMIQTYLPSDMQAKYFQEGYRFKMINTWRSLVEKLEDRPLAVCDFKTVKPEDLIPADRVYPQVVGEVYYVFSKPEQQWYWLSDQSTEELILMIMYDSIAGHARYCPHVSFPNPLAGPNAKPRESVETRSIIISKV